MGPEDRLALVELDSRVEEGKQLGAGPSLRLGEELVIEPSDGLDALLGHRAPSIQLRDYASWPGSIRRARWNVNGRSPPSLAASKGSSSRAWWSPASIRSRIRPANQL